MTDLPMSYEKMKSLILNIRNEIFTDMKIHNQQVLPRYTHMLLCIFSIHSRGTFIVLGVLNSMKD